MGHAVNLIVSCTNRKRYDAAPGLRAQELDGNDIEKRLLNWKKRLRGARSDEHPAADVYMGDNWSIARNIPLGALKKGLAVRLWICSAGYGLIRADMPIKSYQATFAPVAADFVGHGLNAPNVTGRWWAGVCSYVFPDMDDSPRSLASLASAFPRTPIIVALSADYLKAIEADLLQVLQTDFFRRHLGIISCGTPDTHRHWKDNLLPCDARQSGALGGSLTSLNTRIARYLLSAEASRTPTVTDMASVVKSIEMRESEIPVRIPQTDKEVLRFLRDRLAKSPSASKTKLLKEFRASGRACEQKRFGDLCEQLREEFQQVLYA